SSAVGADETLHRPVAATRPHLPSLSPRAPRRCHPKQEPDAVMPHVRIRGGGHEQSSAPTPTRGLNAEIAAVRTATSRDAGPITARRRRGLPSIYSALGGSSRRLPSSAMWSKNASVEHRDPALRALNGSEARGGTPPQRVRIDAPGGRENQVGRPRRADRARRWPPGLLAAS